MFRLRVPSYSPCAVFLCVAAFFLLRSCSAHSFLTFHHLSKDLDPKTLTYISSCPDPAFKCTEPVEIPVPGSPGSCQPYDRGVFSIKGSLLVSWSDSLSLPAGTAVSVCTSVQFWGQSHCRGVQFSVSMPNAASFRLYIARDVARSGELLKLGATGPLRSHFPVRSISCANASVWRTSDQPQALAEPVVNSMEITRAVMGETVRAPHRLSLNVSLLLASVVAMAVFAVFGAAFAYAFKDSLSDLVIEEVEESSSATDCQEATQKQAWFDPSYRDWEGTKTSQCKQAPEDSCSSLQGRLYAVVAAALPRQVTAQLLSLGAQELTVCDTKVGDKAARK